MTITPPPLSPGDQICVIAPAGNQNNTHQLEACRSIINDMGFKLLIKDNLWPGKGFLSDNDDARLKEFHSAWASPDIKAIFALRGGYGSLRLIDRIDYSVLKNNPKIFVGFSDITILLNQIFLKTGIIGLHGPVFSSLANSDRETIERTFHCLTGKWPAVPIQKFTILRKGPSVEAKLLGGNLCSIMTMLGTQCDPDFSNSILFLEDVNEPPYRLDRMLTQLFMSGKLENLKGIILGNFSNDNVPEENDNNMMTNLVFERLLELTSYSKIPIWGDFPAGHCKKNLPLPIGAQTVMDNEAVQLKFKNN